MIIILVTFYPSPKRLNVLFFVIYILKRETKYFFLLLIMVGLDTFDNNSSICNNMRKKCQRNDLV